MALYQSTFLLLDRVGKAKLNSSHVSCSGRATPQSPLNELSMLKTLIGFPSHDGKGVVDNLEIAPTYAATSATIRSAVAGASRMPLRKWP